MQLCPKWVKFQLQDTAGLAEHRNQAESQGKGNRTMEKGRTREAFIRSIFIIFVFCFTTGITGSQAQETLWKELNSKAISYMNQAEYTKAKALLKQALRMAKEEFGHNHPNTAIVMESIAIYYRKTGDEEKARLWEERVKKIHTKPGVERPAKEESEGVLGKRENGNKELTEDLGNGVELELVWIPPGEFMMGCVPPEAHFEGPVHKVNITKGFWMGKYEVTQAQWNVIIGANPSHFKNGKNGAPQDTSNYPVEDVSWYNCQEFLKKLSQKTGKTYRFPTEAEWEYACRSGTTTAFHYGDSLNSLQANFNGNYPYNDTLIGPHMKKTTEVGYYRPNAWGLYDMHGNVLEWCHDWDARDYYKSSPMNDPQGPSSGENRVIRSGSWTNWAKTCRSASRNSGKPEFSYNYYGLRVVMSSTED